MSTSKRKKKAGKLRKALPVLVPAMAVILLLELILLLGNFLSAAPEATEPDADILESNPYRTEDFEYDNGFLRCTAAEARLGIDVSEHQQVIDWEQVKAAGVDFTMIRVGYRGYTEGRLFLDNCFKSHLAGAKAAGLDVGVYFFSQAITPEEARMEAEFLLTILGDRELEMGIAYDWEYVSADARTGTMDGRAVTDCALAFCDTVSGSGHKAIVYFNQYQAENDLLLEDLAAYDFWLAMYSDEMTFPHRVDLWQYTESGTVPGIEGPVDINLLLP